MKRIPIHCSLNTFLNDYEPILTGLVTIVKDGNLIVEGVVIFIFGVGGYYPNHARELYDKQTK